MEQDEAPCPRSRGTSVPREKTEFESRSFPRAKVWLNSPLWVFITQAWRSLSGKASFHCHPCVNAALPSHLTPADAVGLEAQPLLPRCFLTSGPQGGYTQIKGEPKEPAIGEDRYK